MIVAEFTVGNHQACSGGTLQRGRCLPTPHVTVLAEAEGKGYAQGWH